MNHRLKRLLLVAGVTIALDQITKYTAKPLLQGQGSYSYLADTWRFVYSENTGAFLGLGAELSAGLRTLIFTVMVSLFLVALTVYTLRAALPRWHQIGAALLLGGGIGNLIDRVLLGYVIDFMNAGIGGLRTGIFNVADMAILLGIGFMIWPVREAKTAPIE